MGDGLSSCRKRAMRRRIVLIAYTSAVDQNGNQLSKTNPLRQKARGRYVYQVPIILFEDETSGTTSKRWNEHITIYFQNASLPRAELDKPASVRLLSVSTNVSANDLMEAVVEELW